MSKNRKNRNRHRCLTVGCNPYLESKTVAESHSNETGHRVAKWPVRSEEGKKKARDRNRNGYYDKYNVGEKSYINRVANGHIKDESISKSYNSSRSFSEFDRNLQVLGYKRSDFPANYNNYHIMLIIKTENEPDLEW